MGQLNNQTVREYRVVDQHTGAVVRAYTVQCGATQGRSRTAASRAADRLDNAYGAHRYTVQPVWL